MNRLGSGVPCLEYGWIPEVTKKIDAATQIAIAGVEKFFSEAGRAAKIHLEHRVAAIRQQLDVGIETPVVARPRASVHR